jgi:serine/threonine protein kinase
VVKTKGKRACPVCGTLFADCSEPCPVCALRGALKPETGSVSDTSSELRFEHYQVLRNEDGTAIELGHGAMGVTYKAVDINLRCMVALKVINARWVGDELARRRFVREARAAASVRHPNVASVFHLGKSGDSYFYAMEFVEGETLQSLIKRSGRLDVKLALEIATQVAAGLAAVHKQKLIHRDIKPSNIMVSLEGGGAVAAKIIDLGLAKAANESASDAGISTRGAFAGTPEFASPEQFAGVGADIRSDLYSLGVTLWEMLTGKVPFNGSVAEVMYQHLHKPAPVELLKDISQRVIVLLEILLEKDPTQRFQTPNELLNAMPTVTRSIEAKRTIKHQEVRTTSVDRPSSRQEKSPAIRAPKRSIAVLPFDTLSHGKGNTYFADGVQDEILSNLAKVSQLKVISRTSVMTFRPGDNRNLRSIAESLGVANVVEGTVRRDGNRVRITIRLVDARTDKALWSESYDRDLTDIFAIQSEIAQAVASKLNVQLSTEQRKGIEEKPTNDLEAYDLYLQAKGMIANCLLFFMGGERKSLLDGIKLLEEATRKDTKFALAYCLIARAHDDLYSWNFDNTPERRALGDAAVNEALRLRPDLAQAHLASAYHLYVCYRNYDRARVQIAIAQTALPNSPQALALAAYIDAQHSNWEESTKGLERAVCLDPRNPELLQSLTRNYLYLRRYRRAEHLCDRLIQLNPDKPIFKLQKAAAVFFTTRI